jgi:hypothetical protein
MAPARVDEKNREKEKFPLFILDLHLSRPLPAPPFFVSQHKVIDKS